jgi:hypothetical protein
MCSSLSSTPMMSYQRCLVDHSHLSRLCRCSRRAVFQKDRSATRLPSRPQPQPWALTARVQPSTCPHFTFFPEETPHLDLAAQFIMRLLHRNNDGKCVLTEFMGDEIPRYAILSHTWGPDQDEVTFADLQNSPGTTKAGYRKIQFCGDQAAKHNIRYFCIDTCCIDKSSSAELTEAINSMFTWYHDAARCYVFLPDVSVNGPTSGLPAQQEWYPAFRRSRWFTRGWTLQELVAPTSVEFFSIEGQCSGNRNTLLQEPHEITGICRYVLQGEPLADIRVDEHMSWVRDRKTKREEDMAYSMLGVFDVHMPLIYGEGKKKTFARLQREINVASGEDCSTIPHHEAASQHRYQGTHTNNGTVFYGSISGRDVMAGTRISWGTVNYDYREGGKSRITLIPNRATLTCFSTQCRPPPAYQSYQISESRTILIHFDIKWCTEATSSENIFRANEHTSSTVTYTQRFQPGLSTSHASESWKMHYIYIYTCVPLCCTTMSQL